MATFRERNGSYQIRVSAGYDGSGKQIIRSRTWKPDIKLTAKQTEKELQRQIVEFEKQVQQGYIIDERMTFEKYADYVLKLKERTGSKHRTLTRYKELLLRINPAIGYMKLEEIRPAHLNNFYTALSADGLNKRTGGKLSNKTILEHHRLISTIMTQAEKEMLIPYNPAHKATPPKMEQREVNYFQPEQVAAIRDALETEPLKWKVATHLLLLSGCRRGEIMGLKWAKVDFKGQTIRIDNNLLYAADIGIYEDTPKTATSVRTIRLPAETMQLLREWKLEQTTQRIASGDRWIYTDFLFTQENGTPMHPDSLTDWLAKFSERRGLPHINPHAFRHTMASLLYFNGVDSITISKRLGHAKVSTTTDVYSHIIKEADERAADCLGDIILHSTKRSG